MVRAANPRPTTPEGNIEAPAATPAVLRNSLRVEKMRDMIQGPSISTDYQ
jgi:hypothetical protein